MAGAGGEVWQYDVRSEQLELLGGGGGVMELQLDLVGESFDLEVLS